MSSNFRTANMVSTDFYETNDHLVKHLLRVYNRYHRKGWMSIDPAVGRGVILKNLHHPKKGYDISPKFLNKNNNYTVKNYLKSNPRTNPARTIVIGNPPFRSSTSTHLFVDFINHSAKFANTVIFIVPMTAMKQITLDKVKGFTLTDVWYVPSKHQYFTDDRGDKKRINVCIQVFRKPRAAAARSLPQSDSPGSSSRDRSKNDFTATYQLLKYSKNHFDFYVRRLDTLKSLGKVTHKYPYDHKYISEGHVCNGWWGVKVDDPRQKHAVLRRFVGMYENGEVSRFHQNTSIGNWYDLALRDIHKIYYKTAKKSKYKEHHICKTIDT